MSNITKSGTKQWVFQRVSNILIVLFSLLVTVLFFTTPLYSYDTVTALIDKTWFKITASLCMLFFTANSMIAGWQIAGDYVKANIANKIFNIVCILASVTSLVFVIKILWL